MSDELSKDFVSHTRNVFPTWYDDFSEEAWRHTVKYMDSIQAKLDAQVKEIEALRGFCKYQILEWSFVNLKKAFEFGLIDEKGNPTPLLTGDE